MYQAQLQISEQDIRTVQPQTQPSGASFTPSIKFGQLGGAYDSKQFVFGLSNATTALVAGNIQTGLATIANHVGRTQTATQALLATVGSTTLQVTVGATLVSVNQYLQGYATVIAGTGLGSQYRIKSNTSAVSNGTTTLSLVDPVLVALDSTSVVSLYPSPWNGIAVSSTTISSNNIIGVPNVAVPTNNYAWFQVDGYCATLADSTPPTKNTNAIVSASTAGAVAIQGASAVTQVLGYAPETMVSAQTQNLFLQIQ